MMSAHSVRAVTVYTLIQLLRLPYNLLLIPLTRFDRRILLTLVRKIRCLHLHPLRIPKPQTRIVQHLDGEIDGFGAEVHDQRIAFKLPLVILVHLDPGLAAINLLSYDAALGEDAVDLFEGRVGRQRGYIDGGVDAGFLRLLDWLVLEGSHLS